jgi:CRISPR-associated protein Cas5t
MLNVAGIESRYDDGASVMTLIRSDLPRALLALGARSLPEVQSIYQQLHNYPVGKSGEQYKAGAKGSKYNVQPIRRGFLSNIDAYVCLKGNNALEDQVRYGLAQGTLLRRNGRPRYGLPFLGDNSFLVDVLREEEPPLTAYWYAKLSPEDRPNPRTCRLSVSIDRADMSRTVSHLYAPLDTPSSEIPEAAWTEVGT